MKEVLVLNSFYSVTRVISRRIVGILFFLLLAYQFTTAQPVYNPVDAGSKVHFVIKNFGFKTGGDFKGLKGTIHFDPANLSSATFNVSVDAASIDTDNSLRDSHLKKEEYFDVTKYPTLNFKSIRVAPSANAGKYFITGELTIKGVTKKVEFEFSATAKDGGYLFEGNEFEINRRDFNVGSGSFSLQDKLKVQLSVFAKK